jgi:putative transposase
VKYACIHQHRGAFPLGLMCRVLAVARSGYYAWCRRPPSARARATLPLLAQIRAVHAASHGTYGSPRIHAELRATGQRVGRHRVARLMRGAQVVGRPPRRRPRAPPWGTRGSAANRLARQFAVARWQPDQAWVADLTYVPTREGALGLNVVLDLASRRVVGWAMGAAPDSALAVAALRMALAQRRPAAGWLHHSDQGSQFTAAAYQALLERAGAVVSCSRPGNCWDNAVIESFFHTLKGECGGPGRFPSRAAARQAVFTYLEVWYNRHRRHSSLGYRSPVEYEQHRWQA